MRLLLCLPLLALFLTIPGQVAADIPPEKPKPEADGLKLPWTQEEVAKDYARGRAYRFDVSGANPVKRKARLEIDEVTAEGFTMTSFIQEGDKPENSDKPAKKTYAAHLEGLLKRLQGATVSEESVEVPYGKFSCTCYTKESGDDTAHTIEKYWLTATVPGMFIKAEHSVSADKKVDFESWSLADVDILRVKLPWTNAEIAAAWKDGATFKLSITGASGTGFVRLTASEVTAEDFSAKEEVEMDGKALPSNTRKMTWDKFIRQLAEAKCDTVISDESIETPAGKFECACYTTTTKREGMEMVQKAWYVKKSPGLFAKVTSENKKGDKVENEVWELTEYKFGK